MYFIQINNIQRLTFTTSLSLFVAIVPTNTKHILLFPDKIILFFISSRYKCYIQRLKDINIIKYKEQKMFGCLCGLNSITLSVIISRRYPSVARECYVTPPAQYTKYMPPHPVRVYRHRADQSHP